MPAPAPNNTSGPVDRVPCPHCGKHNDFREIAENLKAGGSMVDPRAGHGEIVVCDFCDRKMEVVSVVTITVVHVRQPQ